MATNTPSQPGESKKPYSELSENEQTEARRLYGRAPQNPDRFSDAGEEDFFHSYVNPNKKERNQYLKGNGSASHGGNQNGMAGQQGTRTIASGSGGGNGGGKTGAPGSNGANPGGGAAAAAVGRVGGPIQKAALKTILKLSGNQQKGLAAVLTTVVVLIFLFIAIIPLKLIHIATTLFDHNFKNDKHTSEISQKKLMKAIFSQQLDDNGGHRSATGKWLHDTLTNMHIDKFKDLLAKDGVTMKFEKGRFVGLEEDGKLTTEDLRKGSYWEQRSQVRDIVLDRMGDSNFLMRTLYIRALRAHMGVSFKFWTKNKVKDWVTELKDKLFSKVHDGVAGDAALDTPPDGTDEGPPDPKDKAATAAYNAQHTPDGEAAVSEGTDAAKAEWNVFQKYKDMKLAHKAGLDAFRAKTNKLFGWTGVAMFYCLIQKMVQEAQDKGYEQRLDGLVREGNMIKTQRDQLYTGVLNIKEEGQMNQHYDGDPQADPNSDVDAKDYTQSCAWKRATTNEACSTSTTPANFHNYNPDLSEAANPDVDALNGIIGAISAIFNIPATHQICAVLNSWFGWALMAGEFVINLPDAGVLSTFGKVALGVASSLAMQTYIPKILDAATGLAVTGLENATGLANNADAGLDISSKAFGLLMGDRVGTQQEFNLVAQAAQADDVAKAKESGWTYRTFALDNSDSILSKVVENTPSSPAGLVASIRSSLFALPANFGTIFFHIRPAIAAPAPADPYGVRAYVTTDDEINKYDPLAIEDFLDAPTVLGASTGPNGQVLAASTGKTRLEMLGDPTTYSPDNGDDTNTNDLMHCFVNKYRLPSQSDPICLDLGVLTAQGNKNPQNPGAAQILNLIYCQANNECNLTYNDDFDQYRLYLRYVFETRGMNGYTTNTDPFEGNGNTDASATLGVTSCGGSVTSQTAAQEILNNSKINKVAGRLVMTDLKDAAAGKPGSSGAPLSCTLLNVIATVGRTHSLMVFALESGGTGHTSGSLHYSGDAADIDTFDGTTLKGRNPASIAAIKAIAPLLPSGSDFGQSNCGATPPLPAGVGTFNDTCSHLHVQVPRGAK